MANKIIFKKVEWSKDAANVLKDAFCGDDEFIKNEVERGISELFEVQHFKKIGYIVTRIENNELVLVSAAGSEGYNVLKELELLAIKNNLKSIRMHSRRDGMEKYLKKSGFDLFEKVFKKVL